MIRLRAQHFLLLLALLAGCGEAAAPPLTILGAEFGLLEKDADGVVRIVPARDLPLREGQLYGWRLVLRTDQARIKLSEQLTLAAPAQWNVGKDPRYEVSADRRSLTVQRDKPVLNAAISGSCGMNAGDPPGKASIRLLLEGTVEQRFDFELRRP